MTLKYMERNVEIEVWTRSLEVKSKQGWLNDS